MKQNLEQLAINTLRVLSIDAIEKAKSGHPGMPMGDAAIAYVIWKKFLKHNPKNPKWFNRDRFILSAGHGSMLLYSLLYLTGYPMTLEDIKRFRQLHSKAKGHPEYDPDTGIETTTGPLGQGFATGVGIAIAQKFLQEKFNREEFSIVDFTIYGILSDGDIMEGISHEAASIAGHLKLGSIIYVYSDNKITIEGPTSLTFSEDVEERFKAYGWHVEKVDGYNLEEIEAAIRRAKEERLRPSLIIARTHIGYGSPNKQDKAEVHGAPLGKEEAKLTKKNLGWEYEEEFYVPEEVLAHFREAISKGEEEEKRWNELLKSYSEKYPELYKEWKLFMEQPIVEIDEFPKFSPEKGIATRSASGKVLNKIADKVPYLIGGSADLAPSNKSYLEGKGDFGIEPCARNIHFGVREHAMGAILNGMALTKLVRPYGATFLVFSDYMRPAIRLAAMMKLPVIYIFTHDSIGVGEDGPTHQPVEHLASLRAIPNLTVIRPCDANETSVAWQYALNHREGPVALILSRQSLPVIDREKYPQATLLTRGAYILSDDKDPELIIIATGSEVHLALKVAELLRERDKCRVRVVNMPSWEIFESQPLLYKEEVLPPTIVKRVAIEAGVGLGWERYVGINGLIISVERFGESAPEKDNWKEFGFTPESIYERIKNHFVI